MLKNLRGFSNTKLAGVLIAIIIVPFVFWGMGSVFSGGNTNNVAKINNKSISTQDFLQYLNQSRINLEYVKENIENNVIEEILTGLVSNKLLEMEIENLNASLSENILANKIRSDEKFVDDKNSFSRLKYEKFLLENNLTAPVYEIKLKDQELKKNLFDYVSGGLISPYFLKNKIYINENKELEIEYFNLDQVYKINTSKSEIDKFIKENEDNLKEELIDIKYTKITPNTLLDISEFNDDFFKKIDEIENSIFNGSKLNEIQKLHNLTIEVVSNFNNEMDSDEILQEIYSKRKEDKTQIIDKNDFYLLYEISNIKKILPDLNDLNFIEKVKNQLVIKQKIDYNKKIFKKIQDKKFSNAEFLNIAKNKSNIKKLKINSSNFDETFSRESVELLYSLPKKSFVLIADKNNDVYLSKISNINTNMLNKDADKVNEYKLKSNSQVMGEIYSTYDLSLSKKYNVKLFNSTLERIKNNFR
ncbi:SurA N-terminal domain-containing protein [Candidatus Pelagibacter communis]|uniref:SurA N-terminal domain-containing protein n=1 Tax=Pelagibacter ubique TaxID=198252 RepID=UPI00094C92A7|nr:SurA N-terminal domain-containing protein [Candidatus Pelagibacter ubique]